MHDMMTELLVECSDGLDLIDRHLVALESNPTDATLLTGAACYALGTLALLLLRRLRSTGHAPTAI